MFLCLFFFWLQEDDPTAVVVKNPSSTFPSCRRRRVSSCLGMILLLWVLTITTRPTRGLTAGFGKTNHYKNSHAGGRRRLLETENHSSSKRNKKKKKRTNTAWSELAPADDDVEGVQKKNPSSTREQDPLDKWGLPPPTIEDIFPPMPPGTEIIPAKKENYTLDEMKLYLKGYLNSLQQLHESFDENGLEIMLQTPPTRDPMRLRLVHQSPPVLVIDNFLTPDECIEIKHIAMPDARTASSSSSSSTTNTESTSRNKPLDDSTTTSPYQVNSATFSSTLSVSRRTSTSWFCTYRSVPQLLARAHYKLGIPLQQMEEPQIVRYCSGEEFSYHYDEVPKGQLHNGGQRIATLLVYLNSVPENDARAGGATVFRDLTDRTQRSMSVQPQQGSALLFFPAKADGTPDERTLHKGEMVLSSAFEKHIVQMWIHERAYKAALPSPRNHQTDALDAMEHVARKLGYLL